jgi:CrcB protein
MGAVMLGRLDSGDDMVNYLYVAIGSALGGIARLAVGSRLQQSFGGAMRFPIGTLLVNITGSFLIGVLMVVLARRTGLHYLLIVGFCGGYTTFSTFSADNVALIESGAGSLAALNVAASVAVAFAATFAGILLARAVVGRA